ncbi:MAG: type I restriction enzyme endonuclease domain-containing protein [Betaproteobacteria bacterium]
MTEDQLEQETLGWLSDVGYSHRCGPDIAHDGPTPERSHYRQVVLAFRLREAMHRLNPNIPTAAREDALKQVLDLGIPALLSANQHFHRLLVTGVPVTYQVDGETRGDFVRLIDWANPLHNEWLAVNQFSIKGPQHTRRPDIILFVNGLPLVLLELKNPADLNADVGRAYDQIQTYKAQIPDVFQYNELLVIADGTEALLGSLSANSERFMAWRTIDGAVLDPLGEFNELLRALLHGFDCSGFLTGGHKTLAGAANHVLGLKDGKERDGKKRFADIALAMSNAFTLCCTLDEAKAVREEVAFLQGVKVILTKKDISAKKRTDEQRELAIRQIINSAVVSERVVDIFDAVGLDKPNIGLLDDEFLAQVGNLPEKNLAVELLERLLEGEIKSRFASNVVQDKKFSEMLANVITRYQNRSIETAQVMQELIEMARKFREAASRGEQLDLTEDEVRFYDALANNESAVRELTDKTLKKIAHELTENLRQNLSVDWSERESVQAKLRLMVKRILRKYKYPPDLQDAAVELVLQQAQALGESWML